MVCVADVNVPAWNRRALGLRMAAKAKIGIALHEHFLVYRPVRIVTSDATFPERVVLEDKRTDLVAVALRATLILPGHRQSPRWFHDVQAMRIVALHTIHAAFQYGMMLGKMKLRLEIQVTLEAGLRFLAGIDDKFFRAAQAGRGDVFAAGSVTRLAPALALHRRILGMKPRVRAGREPPHDFRMTIREGFVADEMRSGDFQWRDHFGRR